MSVERERESERKVAQNCRWFLYYHLDFVGQQMLCFHRERKSTKFLKPLVLELDFMAECLMSREK